MFIPLPRDISPEVNVITQLEFELAYYDVAVQHVNQTVRSFHHIYSKKTKNCIQIQTYNKVLFDRLIDSNRQFLFPFRQR